jgi:hypothetical protein
MYTTTGYVLFWVLVIYVELGLSVGRVVKSWFITWESFSIDPKQCMTNVSYYWFEFECRST